MRNPLPLAIIALILGGCAGTPEKPPVTASGPDAEPGASDYLTHAGYPEFAQRMEQAHGFSRQRLDRIFSRAEYRQSIIDAITRPAEAMPWHRYRKIFLTEERIAAGAAFWREHEELLHKAAEAHAVDPRILVAIIGVETFYGRITGSYRVIDALATLGFDYPPRADFFRGELEEFLLLTREEDLDPLQVRGSYAGAIGAGQFIPSSYRAYAVDFDGDGQRDLRQNWADAIGSVANYFARHHWRRGGLVLIPAVAPAKLPADRYPPGAHPVSVPELRAEGFVFSDGIADDAEAWLVVLETGEGLDYRLGLHNFHVITRYNRSPLYATAVHELAEAIARRYHDD